MIDGQHISGSPYRAAVVAGPISPSRSSITGPDMYGCAAKQQCSVNVTARDAWGNVRMSGDDSLVASAPNGSAKLQSFDIVT